MPAPGDKRTTTVMVVDDGGEVVASHLDDAVPDLALVDRLLRLQLSAKRRGWEVVVRDAPADLVGLLELTGLAGQLRVE